MLNNSGDILNVSIAVAVIAVAIFICLTLYHLTVSVRRINKISRQIEIGVRKLDNLMDLLKSRIKKTSSYLFIISKIADKAMDYFNKKKEEGEDKKEKNKKTK